MIINWEKFIAENIFLSEAVIYLSLGLLKGRQSFRKRFQPSKREHLALQNMKFLHFFIFVGQFFAILDADPSTKIHADRDSGSRSATLEKIKGTVSRDRNKVWHQEEEKGQCNGDLK
jgi:hypothetical protein